MVVRVFFGFVLLHGCEMWEFMLNVRGENVAESVLDERGGGDVDSGMGSISSNQVRAFIHIHGTGICGSH